MYDRGQRWETGGELFIQYVFIKSLFYVGDSFLFCLGDTAMDKEEKKIPDIIQLTLKQEGAVCHKKTKKSGICEMINKC